LRFINAIFLNIIYYIDYCKKKARVPAIMPKGSDKAT